MFPHLHACAGIVGIFCVGVIFTFFMVQWDV